MQATYLKNSYPISPNKTEAIIAKETSQRLTASLGRKTAYQIQILESDHLSEALALPAAAVRLLADILSEMAKGNTVTILPVHAELSTQQAANLLNVSRPFLVQLLEDGKIPFHKVGSHRRVTSNALMAYKQKTEQQRLHTLDELTEQAQRLDMGY